MINFLRQPASSEAGSSSMPTGVRRTSKRQIPVVIAACIAGALTAVADQNPAPDQPRPTFRTEANYIRVDVYATARDGTPVRDLRRDEFRLLEDRAPQNIDQFTPIVLRTGVLP